MARAPRRPPVETDDDEILDPVREVIRNDRFNVAADLEAAIESISGYDQGSVKGVLYRVPPGGGKFETIETIYPPFNIDATIEDLKERFGGGDYQLRLFIQGQSGVKKVSNFSIAKEKTALFAKPEKDNDLTMMMFQMMMRQGEESARQRSEDARERAAAAERQTTMIVGIATAALPLIMGGKDKTSEVMAALGPFMNKGDGMKEALETLTLAKGLFKEEPATGIDTDDLVGSGLRLIGPMAGSIAKAFQGRAPQVQAPESREPPQREPLHFAPPSPRLAHEPAPAAPSGRFPVIDLIREDVLYCFRRNHDPEKAADLVFDTLENNGVTEAQINELISAFTLSPDWLGELAAEGLDLRASPEWANDFLASIIGIYSEGGISSNPSGGSDGFDGGTGSPSNLGDNGEPSAEGLAENADQKSSG